MQFKLFLLTMVGFAISTMSSAQDRIYKHNGTILEVKIIRITKDHIVFTWWNKPHKRPNEIEKQHVETIVYENGVVEEDVSKGHDHELRTSDGKKVVYRRNVITIAPVQFTERGAGLGFTYEHVFGEDKMYSFYLPFAMINTANGFFMNDFWGIGSYSSSGRYFYFMPGLKIYPTSMQGRVKYSVAPSVIYTWGQQTSFTGAGTRTVNCMKLGALFNNTMNINIDRHVFLGLEMGLGLTYLNREDNREKGINILFNAALRLGCRF